MNMDHQNMDIRPKRRKAKDNPYTLFTVGIRTGRPQYYVAFQSSSGHRVCIEVEREVFEAMDRFELDDLRYLNEIDNHYEHSELTEATLARRAAHKPEGMDAFILEKMQNDCLKEHIAMLPPVQRRRLVLHYYGQFTCKQIAELDHCTVIAVKKSLDTARKNLKKMMKGVIPSAF